MSNEELKKIIRKLQNARLTLMRKQPFYAVLLLNMQFSLDEMCETIYTDGKRIVFCPDFLNSLEENELEFVLMHEILHAALTHHLRLKKDYDFDIFSMACDIIVNSNILNSYGGDESAITLQGAIGVHRVPNGDEGHEYSAEKLYDILYALIAQAKKEGGLPGEDSKDKDRGDDGDEGNDGDGSGDGDGDGNGKGTGLCTSNLTGFDDHTYWQPQDGQQGGNGSGSEDADASLDARDEAQEWLARMMEAAEIALQIEKGSKQCGTIPMGVQRLMRELKEAQTDWREVLEDFIQEEVTDYSFNPPDRRFQDSPFLLPDYNEKDTTVKDILFMIDTSASMSDEMITQAYSEIKGGIDQFNGKLSGWLGFFDASVVDPKPFVDEDEFLIIRPKGGGGTSFECILRYVEEHIEEIEPASIVILTDGYAPFPKEEKAI